jgi:outer membrane receptor protein involved in Fe transport
VYQANLDKRSLRSALLLGAASVAAVSLSLPASAQDQSTETVVVTGSRIPQQGLYAPSPVTAVGQQEMKFEGTTGVETLLNNLPSVFADQTSGVSNGSTGTATVDLRHLGAVRTLVLVNGTRLMPGDPTTPVADLNQIPSSLVDHVEVLTGGASAVYGSDALAGVVNFVMRKDFEGIELDGQYGIDEADNTNSYYRGLNTHSGFTNAKEGIWDGANETGTLVMGANTDNGKGNVTAYIGYQNTEAVLAGARDFSACTIGGGAGFTHNNPHACAGSSNYNRFFSLDDSAAYYAPGGGGTPYDFFEQGTGHAGSGTFVPYAGTNNQKFNYGALNYLQRPDTRYQGGFFAHYEVNKELDVYSSFMFTDDHTLAQIAPSGLFLGTGALGGSTIANGADVEINCNNPLLSGNEAALLCGNNAQLGDFTRGGGVAPVTNQFGNVDNPACVPIGNTGNCNLIPGQAVLEIGRRDLEGGNRVDDLRHTSYRLQLGARGDLGDGWNYDVYAQYSTAVFSENYQNEFSVSRVQNALEVDPATGKCYAAEPNAQGVITDPKCVPLDIFNGFGSITPAMLQYVGASGFQEGYTEEQIVSGNLTGDLGQYGLQSPFAKSGVGLSVGSEYRAEYLQDLADVEFTTGDLYGQGGKTLSVTRSGFNVVEGFSEIKVPLVQEKPFAEDLSFNAGYRYSSYSTSGSVSSYKYGLEWQPVDDIRFRGSYERAVRAPNVLESFAPANVSLFSGKDPCATSTAGNCASVPHAGAGANSILGCPANQCDQQTSGTLGLRPEIGDTRTIGAVLTPTFLDGFTATVDYFAIGVSGAISTVNPNVALAQCYAPVPTALSNSFCSFVHRNSNGQIYGGGFVADPNVNTGFLKTKGFDFEANYNLALDSWNVTSGYGALQFAFVGTWLQSLATEPVSGLGSYDCAGLYGLTCGVPSPKWRHRLRVTWATPWDVDFSANWRFLSGTHLDGNTANPLLHSNYCSAPGVTCADVADNSINSYWYLDLAADWNVRTGVDLHAGVNNVFDRLPPTLTTNALPTGVGNDNTFPGTYDAMGRSFFIGATIKY